MKIVGVKTVEYEFAGKKRVGYEVYFEFEKDGVDGVCTCSAWVSQKTCYWCKYMPIVGDNVKCKLERHNNRCSIKWMYPVV